MAHAFQEDHQHYFPHGCIICEIIHRLSALEGVVDDMSSAWSEQSGRLTSYVSELKTRFDSLQSQITQLTEQVQNAPDIDSAVADQAARDAEEFKNQLDQLDQAFDLNEPGGGSAPDAGGTPDAGGGETGGDGPHVDNTLPGDQGGGAPVEPPGPVDAGTQDPNAPVDPNSPDAGGVAGPGHPDQVDPGVGEAVPGETAPEGPAPVPPEGGGVDPNDPNAQQPSSAPESPGSDPTQQVPGSEVT